MSEGEEYKNAGFRDGLRDFIYRDKAGDPSNAVDIPQSDEEILREATNLLTPVKKTKQRPARKKKKNPVQPETVEPRTAADEMADVIQEILEGKTDDVETPAVTEVAPTPVVEKSEPVPTPPPAPVETIPSRPPEVIRKPRVPNEEFNRNWDIYRSKNSKYSLDEQILSVNWLLKHYQKISPRDTPTKKFIDDKINELNNFTSRANKKLKGTKQNLDEKLEPIQPTASGETSEIDADGLDGKSREILTTVMAKWEAGRIKILMEFNPGLTLEEAQASIIPLHRAKRAELINKIKE